jgi:hypothetical protein
MRHIYTLFILIFTLQQGFSQCDNWFINAEVPFEAVGFPSQGDVYSDGTSYTFFYLEKAVVNNGTDVKFDDDQVIYGYAIDFEGEIEIEVFLSIPKFTWPRKHFITDTAVFLVVSFTDSIEILGNAYSTNKLGYLLLRFDRELNLVDAKPLIQNETEDNRVFGMLSIDVIGDELLLGCGLLGEIYLGDSLINFSGNEQFNEDDLSVQVVGFDLKSGRVKRVTAPIYDDFPRPIGTVKTESDELRLVMEVNNVFTYSGTEIKGISTLGFENESDILIVEYKNDALENYYQIGSEGSDGVQSVEQIDTKTYLSGYFGSNKLVHENEVIFETTGAYNCFLMWVGVDELEVIKNFTNEYEEGLDKKEPYTSISKVSNDTLLLTINYVDKLITGQDVFVSQSKESSLRRDNSVIFTFANDKLISFYELHSANNVRASSSARINGQFIIEMGWQGDVSYSGNDTTSNADQNLARIKICQNEFKPMSLHSFENEVEVYPNPVKNVLKVEGLIVSKATVLNYLGQEVAHFSGTNQLSFSHIRRGVYIINIHFENGTQIQKRIVKD